jgi:DNA-binding CsgD family transcriptional regulator
MLRQLGLVSEIWMLLTLGDLNDVEAMLKLHQMTDGNLPWSEQILLAWRRGDWNAAVDHAGSAEAWQVPVGSAVADGPVCRAMAEILLARGRPERARMLLHSARATGATLPCLLDIAAADIDMALGASARARKTLMAAAGAASRSRVRVATDEIWLRYTELARGQGDRLAARRGLRETGLAALQVDTDSSRLHHQLATVAVEGNLDAAREATRIARKLNQPYLLARTLERLVSWEASPAALLHEAHERLGALDALLDRARVRTLMRRFRLTVPNRAATVAENERILAILVAEALANRQLAMALHITEKSVESRLTRLFAHAGHRSRVDLATAMTSRAAAATWNPRASKEDVSRREAREPAPECAGGSTRTDAIGHVGPPGDE